MTTQSVQASLLSLEEKKAIEALGTTTTDATARASVVTLQASVHADLAALRTAIVAILAAQDTLATKLNADAGVTDTNYATNNASGNTPAALTTA